MADNTWNKITNRMKALKDKHTMMDQTKELLYPDEFPFQLRNFEGAPIKKSISVTGNQPLVFATAIISDLMGGNWQTAVEGKISSRQSHKIEELIKDNLAQADEMLLNRFGMTGLDEWLSSHVCVRSWIGTRWISQIVDGKYVIDCLPVDMRYTPYRYGKNGLSWVAPISFMSREDLEEEFTEEELSKTDLAGKGDTKYNELGGIENNEVRDHWDGEKNEVWVNQKIVREQPNPFGSPPFAIAFPPSGFMLRDKGYLKHEAPDLFFLNKVLYEELNRSLSVEQSVGMDVLFPPYMKPEDNADASPVESPPQSGETKKVKKGEEWEPLQRGDLNKASIIARQDIQRMIDIGGPILPRAYTQPPSAVEVQTEVELLAKWHYPRKVALQVHREQLIRMMIDQFIIISEGNKGTELLIGRQGRQSQYSVKELGDPEKYFVSCVLKTGSKREEIANWALANSAWGKAPRRRIFGEILKVDDPDGWEREISLEEAKIADPAIGLFEMAIRYAEEAEELEDEHDKDVKKIQSKMLTERGVFLINQRKQPMAQLPEKATVPQVQQPGKVDNKELLPLMGNELSGGTTTPQELV